MGMEPLQLPTQAGCWVHCGQGRGSVGSKQSWGFAVRYCPALDVWVLSTVPGSGEALCMEPCGTARRLELAWSSVREQGSNGLGAPCTTDTPLMTGTLHTVGSARTTSPPRTL